MTLVVARAGLEPATFGLWARRATYCSTSRCGCKFTKFIDHHKGYSKDCIFTPCQKRLINQVMCPLLEIPTWVNLPWSMLWWVKICPSPHPRHKPLATVSWDWSMGKTINWYCPILRVSYSPHTRCKTPWWILSRNLWSMPMYCSIWFP